MNFSPLWNWPQVLFKCRQWSAVFMTARGSCAEKFERILENCILFPRNLFGRALNPGKDVGQTVSGPIFWQIKVQHLLYYLRFWFVQDLISKDKEFTRGTVQKSVCVLSKLVRTSKQYSHHCVKIVYIFDYVLLKFLCNSLGILL